MTFYTYNNLEKNGRLGNQIWQIAATAGRAFKDPNGKVAMNPNWVYRDSFSLPEDFYRVVGNKSVDSGLDYMQRFEEIQHISNHVWSWFQPSDAALKRTFSMYNTLLDLPGEKVCIHLRRGDYLKTPDLFPIPTSNYYKTALSQINSTEFSVFMFSDDIPWVRKNLDYFGLSQDNVYFIQGGITPVEYSDRVHEPTDQYDLFLMSMCDYHIISNSTFSWWGAFLSNNFSEVFYPNPWFGNAVKLKGDNDRCPVPTDRDWKEIQC